MPHACSPSIAGASARARLTCTQDGLEDGGWVSVGLAGAGPAGWPICDQSSWSGCVDKNRVCFEMSCGARRALFDRFMACVGRTSFDSPGLGLAFGLSAHPPETDEGGSVWWTRSAFLGSRRAFGVGVGEWVSSVA
jgi:hypothetical protein